VLLATRERDAPGTGANNRNMVEGVHLSQQRMEEN